MNLIKRGFILIFSILILSPSIKAQSLLINELMPSNISVIYDEDGDTPDWIELLNKGNNAINLGDYYLSDDTAALFKWNLPETSLLPGNTFLVLASGKDRQQLPKFWYTIIDINQSWKYIIPTSEPSVLWKTAGYNDAGWNAGNSGIGYGDNDDNTVIPNGTRSVFMRKKFDITELDNLETLWFNMDFDDGFIAYLNGTEICREGLGANGSSVSFNQTPSGHEAKIYQGGIPEAFDISEFIPLLNEKDNVLAIQVHNTAGSSDFTATPFLTLGYKNQIVLDAPVSKYLNMPILFPHTNFKLSSDGETVILTHKNGTVVDSLTFDSIPGNYSFGRDFTEWEKWGYFEEPTPNLPNKTEFVTDVVKGVIQFSISEMFVSPGTYAGLRGAQSGEVIRYTTDLSEPTNASLVYQRPLEISKNMVLRARIFKTGAVPGAVASRTYILDEKPTLPVVALSTSPENLWDDETGIYVLGNSYTNENPYFGANFWEDWEKPAGIEMFDEDGLPLFRMNCGIKIFGAWSRANPQKSLAVFFGKEYGEASLKGIQLFESKPINEFKSLVIRNSGNDFYSTGFRDGMMTSLVRNMDNDVAAFQPVVLYLNGEYWGHMNLREKINEDYIESNHPDVKADEIDMLETNAIVIEGDNEHYTNMYNFISVNNMANDANYETVSGQMDISNFIDYQLSQIYFDNGDWPGNNIKFWRPQTEDGKWRWLMYDTDFGFGIYGGTDYAFNTLDFATATNGPGWPNPPWSTLVLRKLLENTQFRNRFVNRFADMLNTTLKGDAVIHHIDSIAALIEPEVQNTSKKWNTPGLGQWTGNVNVMRTFAEKRVDYVRTHIKQKFNLPNIQEVTVSVYPKNAGIVLLNSIQISDENWEGKYFENVPVSLSTNSFAGYKFKRWEVNGSNMYQKSFDLNVKTSTLFRAVFEESDMDGKSIAINEINYNSSEENDAGDWIELYNWGKSEVDISGWILRDDSDEHGFVIPDNTVLKSKGYLVLCQNSADFNAIYPDVLNYTGEIDFGFGSTSDAVRLFDKTGVLIDELTYGSSTPWPTEPNGSGATLELIQYTSDHTSPNSWNSSVENLGTPGRRNSIATSSKTMADNPLVKYLKVYPNPFSTEIRIKIENNSFDPVNIQIYSVDGRLVYGQLSTDSEFVWRGDNNAGQKLKSGIYICKVQSGAENFTSKIILNR